MINVERCVSAWDVICVFMWICRTKDMHDLEMLGVDVDLLCGENYGCDSKMNSNWRDI